MTTPLVLRNNTTMPTRCTKCGMADAQQARLVDFRYRPLWARPLGGLGRLFEREASFCFWVCPPCDSKWKWSQPASIATFLVSIVGWLAFARYGMPLALSLFDGTVGLVIGLLFFFSFIPFLYLVDFLVEIFVHRPLVVSARGITKDGMVTLSGVHPSVAAEVGKS
jgi:hypothetical protein